jgi:acetoin utilization deacetylase AcuC-like enzyme
MHVDVENGDAEFLAALDRALTAIREYGADALLVSLGFDASEKDPLGILKVTTSGFGEVAARIAKAGLPTVLIQEGGYMSPILGQNLARFLASFR